MAVSMLCDPFYSLLVPLVYDGSKEQGAHDEAPHPFPRSPGLGTQQTLRAERSLSFLESLLPQGQLS